ncbi:hypothetical protein EEL33_07320 [Muribaculaceae bacterium Isolate-037 (Harlan)]|nr:hypothetical protein EEL33_07320 [Muribaculaceae bacterium Isolate-037 (Harlan)]
MPKFAFQIKATADTTITPHLGRPLQQKRKRQMSSSYLHIQANENQLIRTNRHSGITIKKQLPGETKNCSKKRLF